MGVDHYENFPVASWLCPPALRPPIVAIYRFARTADDIADEGSASSSERLADLAAYRADLDAVASGREPSARWRAVFEPLAAAVAAHRLPVPLLSALLDAFAQDSTNPRYADRNELVDYCRRSADPIGRLLLHLHGVEDPRSLARSDAICTALQLANFWQDLGVDAARGRLYLTEADARRHGVDLADVLARRDSAPLRALVLELVAWTRERMLAGAPLVHDLGGRAGWELRLVVQGGLRILERIERLGGATLATRPVLGLSDTPAIGWRALAMRRPRAAAAAPTASPDVDRS